MAVRVNTVSIGASSTAAAAYPAAVPGGTGIIAGDLIVVNAAGNGTHVLNGQTCQDSVNAINFTQIKEQQLGSSSAIYQQTFYYVTPVNIPDGSNITFTPYAGSTANSFSVDVFRYVLGTITNAVTSQANAAGTSQAAVALGAAPLIGNLVLTFDAAATGSLTPGVAFTAGSMTTSAGSATGTGYASASGASTYASTWTDTGSQVSATQTVAFQNAGVGIPYLVGSHAQAAGSTSNVVTVGSGGGSSSNANDALFCIVGCGGGGVTAPTGVTDTQSHTWVQIASFLAANAMCCWIYQSLHAVTPVTSGGGDTVTVALNNGTYATNCEVIGCAGVNATVALDQTATGNASGNAPAATSGALGNNNELALAVITAGSASQGITWSADVTAMDAGLHPVPSAVYTSVGTQVITSASPVTMGAALGASAVWAELMVTLLPDPPAGPAATITITNTSPLPAGQAGVAYTDQLTATGGSPPYTWAVSAGALPGGLTLAAGTGGGSAADVTYVGVNTGPQGGPTLAQFNACKSALGPLGCYKFFFAALPATWAGTLMDQISTSQPGIFCYLSWGPGTMSAAAINAFIQTIPHSIKAVGFTFDSEPEASWNAGAFITAYQSQANAVHAAQANTPVKLYMMTSSYTLAYAAGGNGVGGGFIPGPAYCDVYGMDFYDRKTNAVGSDMSSTVSWKNWTGLVKGFARPIAITEFGISGYTTDALQNTRLQADWAYIKAAFGAGGSLSQLPLFTWLYWNTGGTAFTGTINQMLGTATQGTWRGIAGTASNQPGGGGGTGGLISGTPSTAAGSPFSFTAQATDTAAATGSKAFTLAVTSSSALTITDTSLPGATLGTPYTTVLDAAGGTPPYTWSASVGSLPTGLSFSGQTITGTPSGGAGTTSFTLKVTDNVGATDTLATSITVTGAPTVTTTSLPAGTVGSPYSVTLAASGGTTPYTWQLVTGIIPDGLLFDPAGGTISGTPTTAGAPILQFQVTDAAGATALSAQMQLSVALATGGIPAIGRQRYGGQESDWTFTFSGINLVKAANVTLLFYSALTGGSQITDLQTTIGGAISSVTSDANGNVPEFYGPAGVWKMAADANGGSGPRVWMYASTMGDQLTTLHTFLAPLTG